VAVEDSDGASGVGRVYGEVVGDWGDAGTGRLGRPVVDDGGLGAAGCVRGRRAAVKGDGLRCEGVAWRRGTGIAAESRVEACAEVEVEGHCLLCECRLTEVGR